MPERTVPEGNGAPVPEDLPVPPGTTGPGAVGNGATPAFEVKGPDPLPLPEPWPEPEPPPLFLGTSVAPPAVTVTVT